MKKEKNKFTQNVINSAMELLDFNDEGIVPAIAQQHDTGEVLMMAWMNEESIIETLESGLVCYYSRSREKLWRKGEESGQIQTLREFRIDCDGDTILLQVEQFGVACHTGRQNCFFNALVSDGIKIISNVVIDPKDLYKK